MSENVARSDTRDTELGRPLVGAALEDTWATPSGFWGALSTVDHKIIGRRYIITAFVFLAMGGVLAMLIRLQLARPEARLLSPDRYNQIIFTMHGGMRRRWNGPRPRRRQALMRRRLAADRRQRLRLGHDIDDVGDRHLPEAGVGT